MAKLLAMNQKIDELVQLAKMSNRKAQLALFDKYSGLMLGVCRQYIKDLQFAEDVMITAFHKALVKIQSYESYGSFEAWLRRIMVYECISYLRVQKNKFNVVEIIENHFIDHNSTNNINADLETIQKTIDQLPTGCKTVFNLYVIEGYKHQEIADLLKISIGTSKSQLAHARKLLKNQLAYLKHKHNGTE